jgi:hypothetical protein
MANGISWKEFEAIVAKLQRTFNKVGVITRDDKIIGKTSGRSRQIDVSIRATVGTENVLIVVECKKWNRKADVKAVEAFAGLKKDVGAQMGIMVSTAGFSKAAYKTAAVEGISLYKYKDTQKENWPNGLETSALMEIWELTPTAASHILADGTVEPITDDDNTFIDKKSGASGGLAFILKSVWESLDEADKREWSWMVDVGCSAPERPEIRQFRIGADAKFIRGLRKGRLHYEGLVNEPAGQANVEGWKMVFDGATTPWPKENPMPPSESYSILVKSVFVKTQNAKNQIFQGLIYNGIFEITVKGKDVIKLPIGGGQALKIGPASKPRPFKP